MLRSTWLKNLLMLGWIVASTTCSLAALGDEPTAAKQPAANEVNQAPALAKLVRAFPNLKPDRPVRITNAADGSKRLFIVSQPGEILVLPNRNDVSEAATFLDITDRVSLEQGNFEEGLLGLAFHPKFKENGFLYVNYISNEPKQTTTVSRFTVSAKDSNVADPASEKIILQIPQPHHNHNGGNLAFGPDGLLYIGMGDGGGQRDPHKNGQNTTQLHGSILRIDVDHADGDKAYRIPADNPFAQSKTDRPEIFAYGQRNIWGLAFDKKTGLCYAANVGEDFWEEINLIERGGNYGWSLREGKHPFANSGVEARFDLIEPIWEYNHEAGKSITGGEVYHGTAVPELAGHYIYADYVTGRSWALLYDAKAKRVVANREIISPNRPFISVGQDEQGEVYLADSFGNLFHLAEATQAEALTAERERKFNFPVLLDEDFDHGADRWQPLDAAQWKLKRHERGQAYSLFEKKSSYQPPFRSPTNIALLKQMNLGDLDLQVEVLSTIADYNHRDVCIVFGYQDPAHFYYVHLGRSADDHANQIFIVNGEARKKISLTTTTGTPWDDAWHTLRVRRLASTGEIEVFFDDLTKPVMTALDKTFAHGRIGLGSFDDTCDWDNLVLRGKIVNLPKPQ